MQLTAKATRKELKQFITIYQSIIEFSLEKLWVEVIIKHNKKDADDMLDDINAKLIEVCDEYIKEHQIGLDKFQLATVVLDLYTQTVSSLDEPFKVIAKESKALVKEYLETNKNKREALERIKKENEEFDRQYEQAKKENRQKANRTIDTTQLVESQPQQTTQPKPKKRVTTTDDLAVDNFILPM